MLRLCLVLSLVGGVVVPCRAQLWERLCTDSVRPDTTFLHTLRAHVEGLAFFRDNEYNTALTKGYSLPGLWLQPKVSYMPLPRVRLELGAHLMVFNGANKYPNYAYHDVAVWKGDQYLVGVHALPWFRAQGTMGPLTVVLGNLYGGENHRLILPMNNPEQNLSADPEAGFQMLVDLPRFHLDTWLNWQSFIFEQANHQEAFTLGTSARILWTRSGSALRLSTPVQLLVQHRGGEQDITSLGVQTLCNGSLGLRLDLPLQHPSITALSAESNVLGSWQQSGKLWPFATGLALHAAAGLSLWDRLDLSGGWFHVPKRYANLYGSPLFGTLSVKHSGQQYDGLHTAYLRAGYTYRFSPAYRLGAEFEAYSLHAPARHEFCFSLGLYFRVSPSFVLRSWRR